MFTAITTGEESQFDEIIEASKALVDSLVDRAALKLSDDGQTTWTDSGLAHYEAVKSAFDSEFDTI